MFGFFVSQLRACSRSWVSVGVLVVVGSCLLGLSSGMIVAGARAGGDAGEEYASLGGMQVAFVALSVVVMLPLLTSAAVGVDARRVSRWQLVGASVRQCVWVYYLMLVVVALLGSLAGGALAFLAWPSYARCLARAGFPVVAGLHGGLSGIALIIGVSSSLVAVLSSGWLSLRSLSRLDVMGAVASGLAAKRRGWARPILGTLLLAGLVAGYAGIASMDPVPDARRLDGLLSAYWGEALGLLVVVALLDSYVTPVVVRLVSGLLPTDVSGALFLARGMARRRVMVSTAVVMPLTVAAGVVGSIMGMVRQVRQIALVQGVPVASLQISPSGQILMEFAPPVVLAVVTAFCVTLVTGRRRAHDIALLRVSGIGSGPVIRSAVCEAGVYVLSAGVMCMLALDLNARAVGFALGHGPVPGATYAGVGFSAPLVLVAGFALLAVLLAGMTSFQSRHDPLETVRNIDE